MYRTIRIISFHGIHITWSPHKHISYGVQSFRVFVRSLWLEAVKIRFNGGKCIHQNTQYTESTNITMVQMSSGRWKLVQQFDWNCLMMRIQGTRSCSEFVRAGEKSWMQPSLWKREAQLLPGALRFFCAKRYAFVWGFHSRPLVKTTSHRSICAVTFHKNLRTISMLAVYREINA